MRTQPFIGILVVLSFSGLFAANALGEAVSPTTDPQLNLDGVQIYVAPKNSSAHETALGKAKDESLVFTKLHKAFDLAAKISNEPGARVVQVLVASGDYKGKLGQGTWPIPKLTNEQASLEILGGFDSEFEHRDPFSQPVNLKTTMNRSGSLISFEKRSSINRVVISGFVLDAAPSNTYASGDGALQRASSRTYPLLSLNNIILGHLVIADNVFINGAHGAFDPFIAPASANTVIDVQNNYFINNVKPIKVGAGLSFRGNKVKQINLRHNSFLFNWPYNPGVTSSNVGAIELNNNESAEIVNFEGNLFAFNISGVFQQDWEPDRMPKIGIRNNLFFRNADLFGMTEPEAGVMVGKFGFNPRYIHFDLEGVKDELEYDLSGNKVFNPGIVEELICRNQPDAEADVADVNAGSDMDAADDFLKELEAEEWEDEMDFSFDGSHLDSQGPTDVSDVFLNGFAQKMTWNPENLMVPMNKEATQFGVQVDRVWSKHVIGGTSHE